MKPHLLVIWIIATAPWWALEVVGIPEPLGDAAAEAEIIPHPADGGSADSPRVYGWKEWIKLEKKKVRIKAKLDTGALTSSIHAEKIKPFEIDGSKWVRFTVVVPEGNQEAELVCEAPFSRQAKIRNADGILSERIVVRLKFRIGDQQREAEFSLNDRGDMIHAVLLGRTTINTLGLVDANRIYLAEEYVQRR